MVTYICVFGLKIVFYNAKRESTLIRCLMFSQAVNAIFSSLTLQKKRKKKSHAGLLHKFTRHYSVLFFSPFLLRGFSNFQFFHLLQYFSSDSVSSNCPFVPTVTDIAKVSLFLALLSHVFSYGYYSTRRAEHP